MPGHHTTKSAAALVGISVATLRNHTVTFAEFLSADASPPVGQERRLHDQDIAVLLRVKELRGQGMTNEAIKQALQDEDISALVPYVDVVATVESQTPTEAMQVASAAPDIVTMALQAIQDNQNAIMQRVEEVEARATERYQSFIIGFLAGIIVVVVVLALVWAGMALR